MSVHNREFHLSNGLTHRPSQSRIYVEAAYSFAKKSQKGELESDEYLNTRWAVNLDDLPLEKLFDETSDRAQHSLGLEKPLTGKYPVIIDADVSGDSCSTPTSPSSLLPALIMSFRSSKSVKNSFLALTPIFSP